MEEAGVSGHQPNHIETKPKLGETLLAAGGGGGGEGVYRAMGKLEHTKREMLALGERRAQLKQAITFWWRANFTGDSRNKY